MSVDEKFLEAEKSRTEYMRFRVTPNERNQIFHYADVAGLNVSQFIRNCIATYENQFRSREDGYIEPDDLAIDYWQ